MHPGIRVLCLILYGAVLGLYGPPALIPAGVLLLLVYWKLSFSHLSQGLRTLRRLRFLLVSLLIVYFWFTPGTPVIFALGDWSPTYEGIRLAAMRVGILVLIVLAVNVLIRTTTRNQLLGAILWLTTPLQWLRFDHERLAVRVTLVLQIFEHISSEPVRAREATAKRSMSHLVDRFVFHYSRILRRAEEHPLEAIQVKLLGAPPLLHWCFPLFIVAGLAGIPYLYQIR